MAVVGIDLGTTNSLISVWRDDKSIIIPNALGELLTPSVVSVDDDGMVTVGRAAKDRLVTHPEKTAAQFKRLMGTSERIRLGNRQFSAEELSALVLKQLKADAESDLVLETPQTISKGGAEGPVVMAGKPEMSTLLLLASRQKESFMPPTITTSAPRS